MPDAAPSPPKSPAKSPARPPARAGGRSPVGRPAGPVLDLDRYVPGLLTFLANKMSRNASAAYGRAFGVNVTEWRILSQIAIEPGVTAARICQVIGFDKGPVSRTLAALERRGYVSARPDAGDGRRRRIALTETGQALHDRILPVALARERRLLACLSPAEQAALVDALGRLHDNLPALADATVVDVPAHGGR